VLERFANTIPNVALTNSATTTEEIRLGNYSGGFVFIPAGSSVTTLTWWVAEKAGGTYFAAYDEDNAAITQTVAASRATAIPAALFGAIAIKAVSNAAGTMAVSLKG
jgi:hypothetical protein